MADEHRGRLIWAAAATGVAVTVWLAVGNLAWPARAMTTFLVAVLPLLLAGQARLAWDVPTELPRRLLYRSSSIALWILAALTALAATSSALGPADLGLRGLPAAPFLGWTLAILGAGVASLFAARAFGIRETPLLQYLLPRTRAERLEFVGVAVTAGITEELVFRGFLITALSAAPGGWVLATLVSAGLFGFIHGYQGVAGSVRAGLLGLLLAVPFLATGSLLPSMVAHTALDLVAGIWLADRLAGIADEEGPDSTPGAGEQADRAAGGTDEER